MFHIVTTLECSPRTPKNTGLLVYVLASLVLDGCGQAPRSNSGETKDPAGIAPESRTELVATISQKVVRIQAIGSDGKVSRSGTGFFVQADGMVATCAHVITGADRISVSTLNGAEFKAPSVIATDEKNDLAFLRVVGADVVPFRQELASPTAVGTPIVVLGNPLGLHGTFTTGVVSANRNTGKGNESVLQISAPISPGVSGAPVVSMKGELIGMVGARADGGENIGFALPASVVWELLAKAQAKHSPEESPNGTLPLSSKRYLPGNELRKDAEWNRGNLPETPGQRLAVLRRLQDRYPGETILQIEIARALHEDRDTDGAIQKCASILKADPANRMALDLLLRIRFQREENLPFIRAAITADPLHFRAREALAAHEISSRQYLAGTLSAQRAVETAPFYFPAVRAYAEGILNVQMDQSAKAESQIFPHDATIDIAAMEANVELRSLIASGIHFLAERNEGSLLAFISLAEKKPEVGLPYVWEVLRALHGSHEEMKIIARSEPSSRLSNFSKTTIREHPLVAEAYMLDYAAVRPKDGLLLDGAADLWKNTLGSAVDTPFDQWAMSWLLAGLDSSPADKSIQPENVGRWFNASVAYRDATKKGAEAYAKIMDLGCREVHSPVLFQFVMACERDRLQHALQDPLTEKADIAAIESALKILAPVPTKQESVRVVRAAIAQLKSKDEFWGFYGDQYALALELAFELAAK